MKIREGHIVYPNNMNRPLLQLAATIIIIASIIAVVGFIAAPSMVAAQNTAAVPGIIKSTNNTATTTGGGDNTTNATASASNATKPVGGYNTPIGHLSAIRHIFDDPALRVQHYCKPNDKIVLVCQLYDSDSKNATLIGIEYIITAEQYNSLPNREKPNWHYHKIEFASNRADPIFPELPAAQAKALMGKLMDTYGKVIITWNPRDELPAFPPQVPQIQHPFMVNATATPNIHAGSFNQTLQY